MLDFIIQHIQLICVLGIAGALIVLFGAMVAGAVWGFVWLHVKAYEKCKEVIRGFVSANA